METKTKESQTNDKQDFDYDGMKRKQQQSILKTSKAEN
jgi:hypothetical protein